MAEGVSDVVLKIKVGTVYAGIVDEALRSNTLGVRIEALNGIECGE